MNREKKIIRTSIIGIIANVLLAGFKAVVGLLSNSVAIVLDAVNNLSDALSSIITIIGTKIAGKQPDKKHPYGHGRVEYLSAIIISVIILYAGITSLIESVKKIISPEVPDYSVAALVIVGVAVLVKIFLGTYVKKVGQEVNSDSLVASGSDAMFDSIISASTLVAAIIFLIFHISLEAYLGVIISLVIIKAGYEQLRDTVSELLGERIDADLAQGVKKTILSLPGVQGAYDLIIHNYGPENLIGSVHIAVPDTMTAKELDVLEHAITAKVIKEHDVVLSGISVYSVNTQNDLAMVQEKRIEEILSKYPEVIQMHGFYAEEALKTIKFDIIIDFDVKERQKIYEEVVKEVTAAFDDYKVYVNLDSDISD
ncbi:MAG: cation transporter [Lachnospiraceae bacterium]|nr:cation transporter [Lachnospiraceae bacterium]